MFRHIGLAEDHAALRINPPGQPIHDVLIGPLMDALGMLILAHERMVVGHHEEALVLLLQLLPVGERTDEMTQVKVTRGPHATEDARLHGKPGTENWGRFIFFLSRMWEKYETSPLLGEFAGDFRQLPGLKQISHLDVDAALEQHAALQPFLHLPRIFLDPFEIRDLPFEDPVAAPDDADGAVTPNHAFGD